MINSRFLPRNVVVKRWTLLVTSFSFKNRKPIKFTAKIFLPGFFLIFTTLSLPVAAQINPLRAPGTPPPSRETFRETDAVASPWIVSTCPRGPYNFDWCRKYDPGEDFMRNTRERVLYNADGSVWLKYTDGLNGLIKIASDQGSAFQPFAGWGWNGSSIVLKMFAESDNWYEVEVNYVTNATKYILKSDPQWDKTSWDLWLAKMEYVTPEPGTEIYDKPEGKMIANGSESQIRYIRYFGKREGDWAKVQISVNNRTCDISERTTDECYPGWIRWRSGKDFLLKSYTSLFLITKDIVVEPKAPVVASSQKRIEY